MGFPESGLFLIPTLTPLASIPDRFRNSPKVSANAKNQLHEKEEIWILANYHLRIESPRLTIHRSMIKYRYAGKYVG